MCVVIQHQTQQSVDSAMGRAMLHVRPGQKKQAEHKVDANDGTVSKAENLVGDARLVHDDL